MLIIARYRGHTFWKIFVRRQSTGNWISSIDINIGEFATLPGVLSSNVNVDLQYPKCIERISEIVETAIFRGKETFRDVSYDMRKYDNYIGKYDVNCIIVTMFDRFISIFPYEVQRPMHFSAIFSEHRVTFWQKVKLLTKFSIYTKFTYFNVPVLLEEQGQEKLHSYSLSTPV